MPTILQIAILALLLVGGCAPSDSEQAVKLAVDRAKSAEAKLATAEAELSDLRKAGLSVTTQADEGARLKSANNVKPKREARDLCWQDYCPCDYGPDYGGADIMICRNLNAGLDVDEGILAGAAGMRDARKALREVRAVNREAEAALKEADKVLNDV